MKLCYLLAAGLILSSLLVAALPAAKAQGTSNCVFFGYWQGGAWHSVSQVVSEMNRSTATGYNQQRNCFIDQQGYYWVYAYEWTAKWLPANPMTYEAFSSLDGVTWSEGSRVLSIATTSYYPREELHQGFDIAFHSTTPAGSYDKSIGMMGFGDYCYWIRSHHTDGVQTREASQCWHSFANFCPVGIRYANLSDYWMIAQNAFMPTTSLNRGFGIVQGNKIWTAGYTQFNAAQDGYSLTGGECVSLSWNSTHCVYVTALGDNSVGYGFCTYNTWQNPMTSMGFSTRSGIDALVGCSDPEVLGWEQGKLHILYVKDSPEDLCHRSFDGLTWSSEEVVATGTNITSPVLSTDGTGLLASWIQDNTIHYRYFDGASWGAVQHLVGVAGGYANWENPRYLSASQMTYGGKILMSWTGEGLDPIALPSTVTQTWIGISLPHVYAAITVWSIALIVGVGAAFMTGDVKDLPYVILIGLGILVVLFVSLTILSAFGSL